MVGRFIYIYVKKIIGTTIHTSRTSTRNYFPWSAQTLTINSSLIIPISPTLPAKIYCMYLIIYCSYPPCVNFLASDAFLEFTFLSILPNFWLGFYIHIIHIYDIYIYIKELKYLWKGPEQQYSNCTVGRVLPLYTAKLGSIPYGSPKPTKTDLWVQSGIKPEYHWVTKKKTRTKQENLCR